MQTSPTPTTSPRTRQQFEPGAYNASEDAVLSVIRRKSETVEITSFEQLAELAGLPVADAEKAARRLVSRGCIKVVPVYEDVEHSPSEFKAVRGWESPDVPIGAIWTAR